MLLFLFLVATATIKNMNAAPIEITTADKKMLTAIRNKFQCCFEDERKPNQVPPALQYAVVYYGNPNPDSVNLINYDNCRLTNQSVIFLVKPDYTLNPEARAKSGCSFVAARLKDTSFKHTEKSCLWSFATFNKVLTYTRCPQSTNRNIYLYTYHNPCSKEGSSEADQNYCTNVIKKFQDACGKNYKSLIIGYEVEYKDTAKYSEKAINAIPDVGMTKFVAPGKDCKTATAAEHCTASHCSITVK